MGLALILRMEAERRGSKAHPAMGAATENGKLALLSAGSAGQGTK
jgi:hypothetical protein